tara:strand:- start:4408 stop:4734 length:327 start_codon:yes stop_codon:yes gene_type:complete
MKSDGNQSLPEGLCPSCFEGQVVHGKGDYVTKLPSGLSFTVKDVNRSKCNRCDAVSFGPEESKRIEEEVSKAKLRKPRSKWNPAPPNQWSNMEEEWYSQNEWWSPFHE